jgi:hypothetical protein
MSTSPQPPQAPPYIPIRSTAWPSRRAPKWALVAVALFLATGVAVGLAHRPTPGQRASDLRGFVSSLNSDVESCAGGVRESLYVLHAIDTGASRDVATALRVANVGAANCSPANNELLDNLTAEQAPESLASFHLQRAVIALIDWAAPDAQRVQSDVAVVLTDRGRPAEADARAALAAALRKLDAQRGIFYATLRPAIGALAPAMTPPALPG